MDFIISFVHFRSISGNIHASDGTSLDGLVGIGFNPEWLYKSPV